MGKGRPSFRVRRPCSVPNREGCLLLPHTLAPAQLGGGGHWCPDYRVAAALRARLWCLFPCFNRGAEYVWNVEKSWIIICISTSGRGLFAAYSQFIYPRNRYSHPLVLHPCNPSSQSNLIPRCTKKSLQIHIAVLQASVTSITEESFESQSQTDHSWFSFSQYRLNYHPPRAGVNTFSQRDSFVQ